MFTQPPRLICFLKMLLAEQIKITMAIIMQNKATSVLGVTVHKISRLIRKLATLW